MTHDPTVSPDASSAPILRWYEATHAPEKRLTYEEVKALVDRFDQLRPAAEMLYSPYEVDQMMTYLEKAADREYVPLPYEHHRGLPTAEPHRAIRERIYNGTVAASTMLTRLFGA